MKTGIILLFFNNEKEITENYFKDLVWQLSFTFKFRNETQFSATFMEGIAVAYLD